VSANRQSKEDVDMRTITLLTIVVLLAGAFPAEAKKKTEKQLRACFDRCLSEITSGEWYSAADYRIGPTFVTTMQRVFSRIVI
jgi:hypothetical protein